MTQDIIGSIFFFPRGRTFIEVTGIDDKPFPYGPHYTLMRFIDLKTDEEHGANFVEEIGKEFHPLPPNYPRSKIDAYLEAARQYVPALQTMHDVDMDIMMRGEHRFDEEVFKDFQRLSDRIQQQLEDHTEQGKPETMRLVIDIPVEQAALAAWISIRNSYRRKNESGPTRTDIAFPPEHAHRTRARHQLRWALNEWFHQELHELCTGHSGYFYPYRKD